MMKPSAAARCDALCSIDWLEEHLYDRRVRILDASFHLPGSGRDALAAYAAGHIPGALRFDVDAVADRTSPLPHMLPDAAAFGAAATALGIGSDSRVVVYDQPGSCAAPRAWWTFRGFGHEDIVVLDGGLAAWTARGLPVTDAAPAPLLPAQHPGVARAPLTVGFDAARVCNVEQVRAAITDPSLQIVDARPAGRYLGRDPEPRPAKRLGHVPGSRNLPFTHLIDPARDGAFREISELAAAFAAAGVDPAGRIIAYCGSGVTACTIAFAAHLLGHDTVCVYDGSWAEWGNRDDTAVSP